MNRRDFLRRSSLLAAGTIAADQLDILDRIGWTRSLFPSGDIRRGSRLFVTGRMLSDGGYESVMTLPTLRLKEAYALSTPEAEWLRSLPPARSMRS